MPSSVLNKYSITQFIHTTTILCAGTVFLCYGLAVGLGHEPAWLPMISDCGWKAPECYFFRFGLLTASAHLYLMANYIADFLNSLKVCVKTVSCICIFMKIASVCLGILVACDEKENNTVHSTAAVIFFIGYYLAMWITLFSFWEFGTQSKPLHKKHFQTRFALTLFGTVDLLLFCVFQLTSLGPKWACPLTEWIGFLIIVVYNFTYAWDFTDGADDGEGNFFLESVRVTSEQGGNLQYNNAYYTNVA